MVALSLQNPLWVMLHRERKTRGLTQQTLARAAGVSVPTVCLLERGQGTLDSWHRVLAALDLEVVGRNLPAGEHIGRQVAVLRQRREVSQRALATLTTVHRTTVMRLEQENRGRLAVLNCVLRVLGSGAYLLRRGAARPFYSHAGVSGVFTGWETPKALAKHLHAVCGVFDLDPCAARKNGATVVEARVRFTETDNGLALPWFGSVYMNPPYRGISPWLTKAEKEVADGRAGMVVALVPVRTDARYWHGSIARADGVLLLRGRLKFSDHEQSAPFPSAVVVWGGTEAVTQGLQAQLSCVRVHIVPRV